MTERERENTDISQILFVDNLFAQRKLRSFQFVRFVYKTGQSSKTLNLS